MKSFSKESLSKLIALALILTISACASKKSSEEDENSDASNATSSSVSTTGADEGDVNTVSTGKDSSSNALAGMSEAEQMKLLKQTEFYFAYDSFSVTSSDQRAALAHGKFLAKTPAAKVRLEGHTDERGTREYNLALGERRAKSVQKLLISAGAKSSQIEVITFGEERPKASGSTEDAYAKNRRVDIQYTVGRP